MWGAGLYPGEVNEGSGAVDPRAERTCAALRRAVLDLAAERPIESVSVAEVARAAGITRGSFYNHASSPVDVLIEILGGELEVAGKTFVEDAEILGISRRDALERSIICAWRHIDEHRDIYRSGLDAQLSPALHLVLTTHFHAQLRRLLGGVVSSAEPEASPAERDLMHSLYAAHAAHGAVGIIETWLRFEDPPDHEVLLRAMIGAVPEWWLAAGDASDPNRARAASTGGDRRASS